MTKNKAVANKTHIYILLDRSGSMSSIANDVIGGFNHLINEQKKNGPDARVTFVQDKSKLTEIEVEEIKKIFRGLIEKGERYDVDEIEFYYYWVC